MELIIFLSIVAVIAFFIAIWGIVQLRKETKTAH